MNDNNRIAIYDNVKFFLMVLVVVGHFVDPYVNESAGYRSIFIFIYSFHMPLFFFISGQFHRNRNILSKVIAFVSIGFAQKIYFVMADVIINKHSPSFDLLSDAGIPWYMFTLAVFIVLSYVLRDFNKKFILCAFVILALFVGYDQNVGDYLYISRIIVLYPYYVLGEMIDRNKIINLSSNIKVKLLSAVVVIVWLLLCVYELNYIYDLRPLFTARHSYVSIEMYHNTGAIFRLLCYFISAIVGIAFFMIVPSKSIWSITKYGERTLQVYFLHWPLCMILMRLRFFENIGKSFVIDCIWLVVAIITSIILSFKCFGIVTDTILKLAKNETVKK